MISSAPVSGRLRSAARPVAAALTRSWPPRSRLFLVGEGAGWSIDRDLHELAALAQQLGIRLAGRRLLSVANDQAAFYGSQFTLLTEPWRSSPHALATAYFHGRPGTPGMPEFDEAYAVLRAHHAELERIQVTHEEMRDVVLSTGIDPAKVFRIRIGVDPALFSPQTPASRAEARRLLGLPETAFVVGSFQKDGVGWGDGLEPKLVKGPDVLVGAVERIHRDVPELHVLLTGPARGYVKRELERLGIPYRHTYARTRAELARAYHALDVYLVASRQEGGPKAVLESLAAGVPLVTTRVGQAPDLVDDGRDGWLVDVDDVDALAARAVAVHSSPGAFDGAAGRAKAEDYAYERLDDLWRPLLTGFVSSARE
jgi:glycosyltransferase involved in cell wall biosynthesis